MAIHHLSSPLFSARYGAGASSGTPGNALVNGKIWVTSHGGTYSTVADYATVWTDKDKTTQITRNGDGSISLDASGQKEIWFDEVVDIRVESSSGELQYTLDELSYGATDNAQRKNMIINGMQSIWEQGTSFPSIANGVVSYTSDMMAYYQLSTGVADVSASTNVPTYAQAGLTLERSWQWDVTTADASLTGNEEASVTYNMEGYDYAQLAGGNATLSFWIYATKAGIYCIGFRNSGADRYYVTEYTVDSSNTWQRIEITVPLTETAGTWDYTNGKGLQIIFNLAMSPAHASALTTTLNTWTVGAAYCTPRQVNAFDNTANFVNITGIQMERGDIATDIELLSHDSELRRCRRYYYRPVGASYVGVTAGAGNSALRVSGTLPVNMRAAPTVAIVGTPQIFDGTLTTNISTVSTNYCTVDMVQIDFTLAGAPTASRTAIILLSAGNGLEFISRL